MNIGRALENRLANDLVYELHHRRFGIVGVQFDGGLGVLQRLEGTICLKDLVESLGTNAVERLHRAQKLRARHQHPLGWLFQKLRRELAAD